MKDPPLLIDHQNGFVCGREKRSLPWFALVFAVVTRAADMAPSAELFGGTDRTTGAQQQRLSWGRRLVLRVTVRRGQPRQRMFGACLPLADTNGPVLLFE
ncbi:MAG: hypothetical protein SNJ75_00340 [Gemmataceae bacterium]